MTSWKWKLNTAETFSLKLIPALIPVTSSQPSSCVAEKERKKRKGIHIRWQAWEEEEEEGGVFNISDSLLLNVVPEPSLHWVAEWGGRFKLEEISLRVTVSFFCLLGFFAVWEMWLLCGFAQIALIIDSLDYWLHIYWKKNKTLLLQTRLLCIAFCLLAAFSLIHCNTAVLYT